MVATPSPAQLAAAPLTTATTPRATPSAIPIQLPAQTPRVVAPQTPEPTKANDEIPYVVNWSGVLRDGALVSWRLPVGVFRLQMAASADGATVEWLNSSCVGRSRPMAQLHATCTVNDGGQVVITNPTTFGLGAAVTATVQIRQLR
jgi:hypothetical protein